MLNNNFGELVKKYERYTSAKRGKKIFLLLALATVLAGGFFLISQSEFIVNSFKKTHPESNNEIDIKTPDIQVKEDLDKEIIEKEIIKKEPLKRVKVETPKSEELPNKVYKREVKKIEKENPFQLEVKERKNLYALLTNDKEKNSYKSAVDIAKFYFDEKNYDKAVTWAVKASKKDPKQSQPWIIYAKSKASLDKAKVAKKALSIYLKHTDSKEVRNLLDSL